MLELVDPDARVDRLATGFGFVEGPVWHPRRGCLLFSDIPGDRRHSLEPDGTVTTDRWPTFMGNGMTLDAELRLLVCEHASSSLVRESADGSRETLAFHLDGRYLNSPNDVVVHSDGSIWFTDPWYGRRAPHGVERPRVLGFQGVYRLAPGATAGELELVVPEDLFAMPNGLCFSPDESLLYVDDTPAALIRVFELGPDGSLDGGEVFAGGIGSGGAVEGEGVVDGMRCDERGNVWVTGPDGIWVLSPAGERLGVVRIPEVAANLTWGGPSWRTLFVTACTSVYALPTLVGPRVEPYMGHRASS